MGFLILLLRVGVTESGMFNKTKEHGVSRGDFLMIFKKRETLTKFIAVILIGVPIWYVIGILVTFAPEFGKDFGMAEAVTAGKAVMWSYLGLALGDFLSGFVSQALKSRKKAILLYIASTAVMVTFHLLFAGHSAFVFYGFCVVMGFFGGYWAMFVTVAAEQFGTNIRSTVTTSVPNFVRASVIPATWIFQYFKDDYGVRGSGAITGVIAFSIGLLALLWLEETFNKDLDYHEV
jgi:MFS transporter, putative metabolite:H+ symporter